MKRSTVFLVLLGFVLVTAVWWFFLIGPKDDAVTAAENELTTAQNQSDRLKRQIAQLNAIADQELTYTVAIGEMQSSIPEEPEFDTFLEDLIFLAERAGVDLVALSANPPAEVAGEEPLRLFRIDVNMVMEGQFFEILGFLYGLEDLERLVRIDTLSMVPVSAPDETTTTTTTTTLAPDGATVTTTTAGTTTTTVPEGRLRPSPDLLSVNLSATLFTRTPLAAPALDLELPGVPGADEEEEQ